MTCIRNLKHLLILSLATVSLLATADVSPLLDVAYVDEVQAKNRYEAACSQFGNIRPFIMLRQAEERHMALLQAAFSKYGLPLPAANGAKNPAFTSIEDACSQSITAEKDNVAMYDDLMSQTKDPYLLETFATLRSASLERHIPALQRCLTTCPGRGANLQGSGRSQVQRPCMNRDSAYGSGPKRAR